ncbi:MAG: D-aminoacylase [wastewater metagenome]|nr:D-aminoacylase [Candidatus Loosdrechtia aerotolerans]
MSPLHWWKTHNIPTFILINTETVDEKRELMNFDLLIKNGTVIDGTGMPKKIVDIGIKDEIITLIDCHIPGGTCPTIDADGMIVAPGFIDVHSHSDFLWLAHAGSDSKIFDGVTTELCGNCGLSAFPLRGKILKRRVQGLAKYNISIRWNSAEEFYDTAEKMKSSINRAFLVGHGNIRACVIDYESRSPDSHELFRMVSDLEEAMNAGAFGMSSGLIYPPGCYSTTAEISELCKVVKRYGGLYATHIRGEGDTLEEAITEAVEVSKHSGVKLQISHLKTSGSRNWHKVDRIQELLERALDEGVDVTCDRYPYTAAATDLDVILPHWVYEGGTEKQIRRLQDIHIRKQLIREVTHRYDDSFWNTIVISSVYYNKNKWMEGKSISEIATELKKSYLDTVFDLLIEEDTRVDIFLFSMCEENLGRILSWDFVFIGSDSAVRTRYGILGEGRPHPRSYGTFSRALGRFCRDMKLLPLEKTIQKMTGLPAQKIGLDRRGFIKEGYFADITIFDPEKINDKSTYTEPHQYSEGIEHVLVNGHVTVRNGKHTGITNGRILRHLP